MHVHNNPLLTLSSLIMENRPEGLSRKCCKVKGKTVESIKLFANSLPVKDSNTKSAISVHTYSIKRQNISTIRSRPQTADQ